MHPIAQIKASNSAWRGERLALTFLAPNKPPNPGNVLNQPCPENKSISFQEPSVKHHLPVDLILGLIYTSCATLGLVVTCASAHNVDSNSAKLNVSFRSISRLLKTLLFRPFQMYHIIHAN